MSLNNLNSRFRLSTNDILSTPTPKPSHFLSSTPVLTPYNFITTQYALNGPSRVSQEQMGTPCPQNRKRKKENQPLSDIPPSLTNSEEPKRKKRAYGPRRSTADKLAIIFNAIRDVKWTLGEFLYHTFQTKDKNGLDIKRTTQHAMYATHFLQGETSYSVGTILECWYLSSDGRVHEGLAEDVSLYSTTSVYTSIKPARAALTAFAAQIIEKKISCCKAFVGEMRSRHGFSGKVIPSRASSGAREMARMTIIKKQ